MFMHDVYASLARVVRRYQPPRSFILILYFAVCVSVHIIIIIILPTWVRPRYFFPTTPRNNIILTYELLYRTTTCRVIS